MAIKKVGRKIVINRGGRPRKGREGGGSISTPGKATPATLDKVIEALEKGLTVETSCALAGISAKTFYRHINKDKTLSERYSRARFNLNLIAASSLSDNLKTDRKGDLSLKVLEKLEPKKFGERKEIDLQGTGIKVIIKSYGEDDPINKAVQGDSKDSEPEEELEE